MKAYDGLTAWSPAHVHQAPVMYEPIADPFNRLSVHISHQRAPVTTVIAIANIAILIIVSVIMIYTFVAIAFCKKFFTVIQAPLLFPLFPRKIACHYYRCQLWRHIVAINQGHNF